MKGGKVFGVRSFVLVISLIIELRISVNAEDMISAK